MIRILLVAAVVSGGFTQFAASQETPALKLKQEQTVRVRELARTVQTQATLLQARLDERQRELAEIYGQYELDERRAQTIQAEIVDLQRALLANHHRMQVELRAIVDKERFVILRQRLRHLLTPVAPAEPKPSAATRTPVP